MGIRSMQNPGHLRDQIAARGGAVVPGDVLAGQFGHFRAHNARDNNREGRRAQTSVIAAKAPPLAVMQPMAKAARRCSCISVRHCAYRES